MKLFRTLISLEDALKTILSYVKSPEIEEIGFDDALNRVLAEDIYSPVDSPPFDRAAMDGYALRGEDSFSASLNNPVFLKKKSSGGEIGEGEYLPIQTGMPLPKGSNAVVMLEYAKESGDTLEIFKPVTPGKNVSFRGEDVKKGEEVLKEGRMLKVHDIGMLASLFRTKVRVYKKAKFGIISTGDELSEPKESFDSKGERKIADVNSYVLEALVEKIAIPYRVGIVRDDYEEIKNAITSSLMLKNCDALLISGGSSVGKRDIIADVVEDLGKLIFHGVAIRPGEPTGFGVINNKPVFVLPGYPVATISAFEMLVRPFLYAMHGMKEERRKIFAGAGKKIPSAVGRTDFVRVRLICTKNEYYVEPIRVSGSGILSSMTKSDGFVIIEENKEGIEEGEKVEVNVWEW
ncbi:MAG: molybdopterin molybdotransferase MoeA [Methanophagales archaeon]|nr:molybdopterin molybdotransferase MoeA [Methanophagales archaeon]MCW3141680.1 molybdopterin molybdotransferase MoeA [Methanophagales archaeon]